MRSTVFPLLASLAVVSAVLLQPSSVEAQSPFLYSWGPRDGLIQYSVSSIVQDRQGYMWFGTESGVSRFNGREFTSFDTSVGFTSEPVVAVVVSGDEVFLIAESTGLYQVRAERAAPVAMDEQVVAFLPDPAGGEAWVVTLEGLRRGLGGETRPLPFPLESLLADRPQMAEVGGAAFLAWADTVYRLDDAGVTDVAGVDERIVDLFASADGKLAVVTRSRLIAVDPADGAWITVWQDGGALQLSCGFAGHGRTVLGTTSGALITLEGDAVEVLDWGLPPNNVMAVFIDREDNIWAGLDSAGVILLPRAPFTSYTAEDGVGTGDAFYLVADSVRGGVWVGTRNGGAAHIKGRLVRTLSEDQGLMSNRVRALYQSRNGSVFIGTAAGIEVVDPDDGRRSFHSRPDEYFQFFFEDENQTMYSGSRQGTLVAITGSGMRPVDTTALPHPIRLKAMVWHQDRFYLGTGQGVYSFVREGEYEGPFAEGADIREFGVDGEGALWATSRNNGTWRLENGVWQRFGLEQGFDEHGRYVVIAPDGSPWFAGNRGIWSYPDVQATRFDVARGLSSDNVFLINFDPLGQLWVGSNLGLDLIRDGTVSAHFDWRDGLADNELNRNGFAVDENGDLWFCTMRGVSRVDPTVPPRRGVAPLIHLAAVDVNDEPRALEQGRTGHESLRLKYSENSLRFHFSGQSFIDPAGVSYSYRLEEFDDDWSRPDTVGRAHYPKLPPGRYTFRVRCLSVDELVSAVASVTVEIVPALWQRRAFHVALGVLVLGAVVGALSWRNWRVRQRNIELERLVAQRTQDLAEANAELRRLSITDPLTGLYNRRFFEEEIDRELAVALRAFRNAIERPERSLENLFLGIFMLDLDHFKRINDELGHDVGDAALREFGEVVRRVIRTSDTMFRWGGEEFLLLARATDAEASELLAERLRLAVADHAFEFEGHAFRSTCSVGYASYPFLAGSPGHDGWIELVHLADQAL
ncbi:MAG: diguanylate cyclase, partial [Deltaproteobacteria bacterium]|nr:diguanylate cyclase [Deltaproteobacteria bacterium]